MASPRAGDFILDNLTPWVLSFLIMEPPQARASVVMPFQARAALSAMALAVLLAGAWYLHGHPPSPTSYYPGCVLHQLTGLHCPGCGGTRCAHALLHLRVRQALHMNALTALLLPVGGWMAVRGWWRWLRNAPPASAFNPTPRQVGLIVIVIFGFAILRNLPWVPFTWLAPE